MPSKKEGKPTAEVNNFELAHKHIRMVSNASRTYFRGELN